MNYECSQCHAPVGALVDPFQCHRTGSVAQPVAAVIRRTKVHRLAAEERARRGHRARKRRNLKPAT
jgi:hypothetical protein